MLCDRNFLDDHDRVLVVGGGVAGMHAALTLAALDVSVLLVEKNAHLGGNVLRLDKVYPTDHCAFCQTWSTARQCYDSPLIQVLLHTEVLGLSTDGEGIQARLTMRCPLIDPSLCLFCGACRNACPHGALLERDPARTWDPALPPVMRVDQARCNGCGQCAQACPVGAINLEAKDEELIVPVTDVIYATGFEEPQPGDPRHAPEFGTGSHPDILTAMEFEAWQNEGRGLGPLCTPSGGKSVRKVAFVQCAGARDRRHLPYCAAVCCMHAMKQARWLKRRQPALDIALFYTDLRAPGAGQERYMRAGAAEGLRLLRSRPGLVMAAEQGGVGLRYAQPETGRPVGEIFDLAVINGGLGQCPLPSSRPGADGTPHSASPVGVLKAGFCDEPADVAGSVIQGAARAVAAVLRRHTAAGGGCSSNPQSAPSAD
ncbi:MAG: CoB--CoM heterodisulfide reductase iron-sulfur subunit A family protein [Desulfovibrio sp.]|nr:CoB--CoM heterodisulfide reductase iron-sulfur subunit A family protein [Desulfovibrio sp.]